LIISVRKRPAALAAAAAVGFSTLFLWASPASAATTPCGTSGTLLAGNICEQTFTTAGTAVFTPTAHISQLQVLLVAGGGGGISGGVGYAGGGGGGQVKVVDFSSDTSTPLNLVVGDSGQASSVAEGTAPAVQALPGTNAEFETDGASGSGNPGWATVAADGHGGGGGAGTSPTNGYDGGAGATAASVAPTGSLFSNDTTCYGGGGAVGVDGSPMGVATCGAGYAVDPAGTVTVTAPTANSGGGGGGASTNLTLTTNYGASGVVVVRWKAPASVTLTFANNGHGASVASEKLFVGETPTQPADPTADGFAFRGWYSDAALTSKADFSAPITASTTFYASWDPTLALTGGGGPSPWEVPLGIAALGTGLALFVVGLRRARKTI
jgi:uncharacterized repeat protein (TIGR02543 family)